MKKVFIREFVINPIIFFLLIALTCCKSVKKPDFDILILDAIVATGDGSAFEKKDIGIKGDSIAETGNLSGHTAIETINAAGLILSPGFIDIHTHCDFTIDEVPTNSNLNYLMQGVTSVVTGNCGYGTGNIDTMVSVYTRTGIGTNVIPMTGFGWLRNRVMGKEIRKPTSAELDTMRSLLRNAIQAGSWGMTTGLQYMPEKYSQTDELISLAQVLSREGGLYSTHMRSEEDKLTEAVQEAITICREAGIPLNISHLKANGKSNWPHMEEVLNLVEKSQKEGMTITADMYPYDKSATMPLYQTILIPDNLKLLKSLETSAEHEKSQSGADSLRKLYIDELKKALGDPVIRKEIRLYTEKGTADGVNWIAKGGWNYFSIVSSPQTPWVINKMFVDLAGEQGRLPFDIAADLIIKEGEDIIISLSTMSEENIRKQLQKPWVMLSSDGESVAPDDKGVHPRNYGSQVRLIRKYVNEENVLPIEQAIYKMTGLPAKTYNLYKRGLVKQGYFADLVVFNKDSVKDNATFLDPHQYPSGIEYVILNGEIVVAKGQFLNKNNGRVLLKK